MPRFSPLIDSVPPVLKVAAQKTAFLEYVTALPISRASKRKVILQWARLVGEILTPELFAAAGAGRPLVVPGPGRIVTGSRAFPFRRFPVS